MREILFRGKTYTDKWVYGYLLKESIDNEFYILENVGALPFWINPETVGQFTGLTDKNGKKIFEGDIIADCFGRPLGVVAFGEHYFDSGILKYTGFYYKPLSCCEDGNLYDDTNEEDCDRIQVIGNLHDNPELLKVVKE